MPSNDNPVGLPSTGTNFSDIYDRYNTEGSLSGDSQTLRVKQYGNELYAHKSWSFRKLHFWGDWFAKDPEMRDNKKMRGAEAVKQSLDREYGNGFGDRMFKHIARHQGRDLETKVTRGDLGLIRKNIQAVQDDLQASSQPPGAPENAARKTVDTIRAAMRDPKTASYYRFAFGGIGNYNEALTKLDRLSQRLEHHVPGNARQVRDYMLRELKHIGMFKTRAWSVRSILPKKHVKKAFNRYTNNPELKAPKLRRDTLGQMEEDSKLNPRSGRRRQDLRDGIKKLPLDLRNAPPPVPDKSGSISESSDISVSDSREYSGSGSRKTSDSYSSQYSYSDSNDHIDPRQVRHDSSISDASSGYESSDERYRSVTMDFNDRVPTNKLSLIDRMLDREYDSEPEFETEQPQGSNKV